MRRCQQPPRKPYPEYRHLHTSTTPSTSSHPRFTTQAFSQGTIACFGMKCMFSNSVPEARPHHHPNALLLSHHTQLHWLAWRRRKSSHTFGFLSRDDPTHQPLLTTLVAHLAPCCLRNRSRPLTLFNTKVRITKHPATFQLPAAASFGTNYQIRLCLLTCLRPLTLLLVWRVRFVFPRRWSVVRLSTLRA